MQQLDKLYHGQTEWLNYEEINTIVQVYKDELSSKQAKDQARAQLLRAYHKYFMKYVALLKGLTYVTTGKDTTLFLALFNSAATRKGQPLRSANRIVHKKLINICKRFEAEEIYNELVTIFLRLLEKFTFKPGVSFAHYVTQYMRWDIKVWLLKAIHEPVTFAICDAGIATYGLPGTQTTPGEDQDEYYGATQLVDLPELNLAWVAKPAQPIFAQLTHYERFLIYLRFKEGLSLKQISEKLGRNKDTIYVHLEKIMAKLRTIYQEGIEYDS